MSTYNTDCKNYPPKLTLINIINYSQKVSPLFISLKKL
jgi:hypothetical protein